MGTYDVILSAETIYSLDSQQRLLACIKLVEPDLDSVGW